MGKIRKGRSQREDVKVINNEWVKMHEHILTPRDIAMLKLLSKYPIMTTTHLYYLTPETYLRSGKRIAPFYENAKGEQICRDRIRKLFDYHFVNKYSPQKPLGEGTSEQYIWLDRAGYKLLDLQGRPSKRMSAEYSHHARILDILIWLVDFGRDGVISIDYIKPAYSYKPKTINIEPDLVVAFRKDGFGYKYLIEVDNCEKKESDELRKLEKYRDWELSSSWIKEPWANIYKMRFPTVLYIFSGSERKMNRRIKEFSSKAKELELRSDFIKLENLKNKILQLGKS